MPRCPITYEDVSGAKYSMAGLRLLSRRLDDFRDLEFSPEELRREALARADKMSIQGLEPKLSVVLNVREKKFEIVDRGGRYILKPPVPDYPEVPENEDLTMRMAAAAGIEVPLHGMVYTADGSLCYFIRRFDRMAGGRKRQVEDFAQLLSYTRDTKYAASVEQVIGVLDTHCTFPSVERLRLFRRVLFAFLSGNEDMHLKNFSLIVRDNKVELSPAYDLLNTTIALANPREESALPIGGKKSNLRRDTLIDYLAEERLGLRSRAIDSVLDDFRGARPVWKRLLERSFLSPPMREAYEDVLEERWERLGL